ncbi:hypothetical protein [Microcoleus sp. PH2017_35_SFW_U_B]|uniref:hypothetical protein n=1 Tax=Microcoleus sp. PH2017_35_SFW_U_B TaxID=2798845 RepID=UPI0025D93595|nr:hypothetical protein [Microcoleus sp. PH2017_35_SFW_U_B]
MTALFRRIGPSKKLRITARSIAKFLKISQNLIKRVESWAYVVPQVGRMAKCDRPSNPNLPHTWTTLATQNINSARQSEIQQTISPKNY